MGGMLHRADVLRLLAGCQHRYSHLFISRMRLGHTALGGQPSIDYIKIRPDQIRIRITAGTTELTGILAR
jgi:hypothetical protein